MNRHPFLSQLCLERGLHTIEQQQFRLMPHGIESGQEVNHQMLGASRVKRSNHMQDSHDNCVLFNSRSGCAERAPSGTADG